jgi:hypothetical protein
MGLPDFLVVGAPKAGSTAIHAALERHPQLYLSDPKEPKYFLTGGLPPRRENHRGPGDRHSSQEWIWDRHHYEHLFDRAAPGQLTGESTPFYLWDRRAHLRIKQAIPEVKLIAAIRDPVDRAYSNWTHLWADGLETEPDFRRACELESRRAAQGYAPFWRYLELGRYGEQLEHLFSVFDREQVFVLRYRDLVDRPAESLNAITGFLGVEQDVITSIPSSNVSSWAGNTLVDRSLRLGIRAGAALGAHVAPQHWRRAQQPLVNALHRGGVHRPQLEVGVRRELVSHFTDDVAKLSRLLGNSYDDWLSDAGRGTFAVRKS